MPEPQVADIPNAAAALNGAFNKVCPWFLAGKGYSMPAARKQAADAGFHHGSSANYFPAGPSPTGATVALGFTFLAKDVQTSGKGVATFLAFDPTACQIQVFGDAEAVRQFKAKLIPDGWRISNPTVTPRKMSVTEYEGRLLGSSQDVRLVLAEPADPNLKPKALQAIVNVLPLTVNAN